MSEFIRLYSKRTVLLIAVLMILNTGFFLFSCRTFTADIISSDEITEYNERYSNYGEKVIENCRMMAKSEVFGKGYSLDNTIKTAIYYYNNNSSVSCETDTSGIQNFISYRFTDCFVLIFLSLLSVNMMTERKKGLVFMIRSTTRGRLILYINRVLILAFSSLFITVLFYLADYAVTVIRYGNVDLSADIRALPAFAHSPYSMTAGEYIINMIALRAAVSFTVSLMFFILISTAGAGIAYIVSLLVFAAEYFSYMKISPVSSYNIFRYVNLYAVMKFDDYFSDFMFIRFFGHAVSPLYLVIAATVLAAFLTFVSGMFIHGKGYAKTSYAAERISEKISVFAEKISLQRSMAGWEIYKLFIKQKGFVFVTAAVLLALSSASGSIYRYNSDYREYEWYKKYEGQITESVMNTASKDKESLEKKIGFLEKRVERLKKNPHESTMDYSNISFYSREVKNLKKKYNAFSEVYSDLCAGYEYNVKTGGNAELIKPYTYEILLTHDKGTRDTASLYILIAIIGSVSGIFAYDTQNNMRNTIRTSYRGRTGNIVSRLVPVCIVCALMSAVIHLVQFVQVSGVYGLNNLDSPVHSLPFISENIPDISIINYLVLLFAARALWGAVTGLICCTVSRFSSDTVSASVISLFIFVVPSIAAEFIPEINFLSAVYLIGGGGL